jgi:hypothetical protein
MWYVKWKETQIWMSSVTHCSYVPFRPRKAFLENPCFVFHTLATRRPKNVTCFQLTMVVAPLSLLLPLSIILLAETIWRIFRLIGSAQNNWQTKRNCWITIGNRKAKFTNTVSMNNSRTVTLSYIIFLEKHFYVTILLNMYFINLKKIVKIL